MPRRLSAYTFDDFVRLRPLTQALKSRRYRKIDRYYFALPDRDGAAAAVSARIGGRKLLATVAFEDPEGLEMHLALVKRFVHHGRYIVADNSRTKDLRDANRMIAAAAGVDYLSLPENPWTKRNDSRSHGLALNWLWHNVVRPGRPEAFGFVDDDLFAIAPVDPFAPLAKVDFHGDQRTAGERWFLWAGYCFFRFAAVADQPLDFGLDWFLGLDTGGANWEVLYRRTDRSTLPFRPVEEVPAIPGKPKDHAAFEKRIEWLHEVGSGFDRHFRDHKREAMVRLLLPHLPKPLASRLKAKYGP